MRTKKMHSGRAGYSAAVASYGPSKAAIDAYGAQLQRQAHNAETKAADAAKVAARRQVRQDHAAATKAHRQEMTATRKQNRLAAAAARLAARLGVVTSAPSDSTVPPAMPADFTGSQFGGGGGGGADPGTDPTADSASSPVKSGGGGLTTKEKVWIGVGIGGAVVLYLGYRYVTAPFRKYKRVKGLVSSLIGEFGGK